MNSPALLRTALFVTGLALAATAAADPLNLSYQPDLTAARVLSAGLHRGLAVPAVPNQSPRISGPDLVLDPPAAPVPLTQVAGRCGSSNYYCDTPPNTYCCGNSSNGFYCAPNVNGCTK